MEKYRAFRTNDAEKGLLSAEICELNFSDLPQNDVLVQVLYSSINYKDALSANGNKNISKNYPHTPGIDAAGIIVTSKSHEFKHGEKVLVTGFDLGMNTPGGLAEYISVPSNWLIKLPENLSALESMAFGTAGLTAAMCIDKLIKHGIKPSSGKIIVSGASGGVGSMSISILSKLGFNTVALSSKNESEGFLKKIGSKEFILSQDFNFAADKPMMKPIYAGGIDCLGGKTISNILKQIQYNGAVSACGMAENIDFTSTVYPFILRGISLYGIDSVQANIAWRKELWDLLADKWKPSDLEESIKIIGLEGVKNEMQKMLDNKQQGRIIVKI
jgi:acrylyl-CoA reductase (NADPH)